MTSTKSTDDYDWKTLNKPWYAVPNDLIGGWCVATVDQPPSNWTREEVEAGAEVGDFMSETIARYIAALHNQHATVNHNHKDE